MNRTVFVTGATSGIGRACAEKFACSGDHIIINGRRHERLDELKTSLLKTYGSKVHTLPFDVRNRQEVEAAIGGLPREWTNIDILINNAGLALGRDYFDEADQDDWDTMIDTNIKGLLYVSRAVLPFRTARKSGHIINIGSVAAKDIYEKGNAYCASKAAVDALSHSMRIDLLRHHVKVTAIHPGAVKTEFGVVRFKGDEETANKAYDGLTPLTGSDIADIILYCCNLPVHVCINDLVVTPIRQADGIYFNRS